MNLLFVCTGNTGRSPMAAALLRGRLADSGRNLTVMSAGTSAIEGASAEEHAKTVMRERGLDLSDHRARRLDGELVGWADLILCMKEEHIDTIQALSPGSTHVYSLRGFLDAARAESRPKPGEALADWLNRLPAQRGDPGISDPIEHPLEEYQQTAEKLETLIDQLATVLRPWLGSERS